MGLGGKEKFLKIYVNLPLGVREEIILVLEDGRPITWNAAYIEVKSDTPISEYVLDKLEKLEII